MSPVSQHDVRAGGDDDASLTQYSFFNAGSITDIPGQLPTSGVNIIATGFTDGGDNAGVAQNSGEQLHLRHA